MNKTRYKNIPLFVALAASLAFASSLFAEWELQFDMETEDQYLSATANEIQQDAETPGGSAWIDDPFQPGNKVVEIFAGNVIGSGINLYFWLDEPAPTDRVYTLYHRHALEGDFHSSLGTWTDETQDNLGEANVFSRKVLTLNWSSDDKAWDWRDGLAGAFTGVFGKFQGEVWYEFWYVVDPVNFTCDVYVRGGPDYPEQTVLINSDGIIGLEDSAGKNNFFLFDGDPITALKMHSSAGVPGFGGFWGNDSAYHDDIYIDRAGENLSSPVRTKDDWEVMFDMETEDQYLSATANEIQQDAETPGGSAWIEDPFQPGNKVVEIFAGNVIGSGINLYFWFPEPAPTDRVYTLYHRHALEGDFHSSLGTWTDETQDNLAEANVFSRKVITLNWSSDDKAWDWRDGLAGAFTGVFGKFRGEVWYEFWYVVDPVNFTCDVYVRGGPDYPEQTVLINSEGIIGIENSAGKNNFFLFDGDPITALKMHSSAGVPGFGGFWGNDSAYHDDIAIDRGGVNLTSPVEAASPNDPLLGGTPIEGLEDWFLSEWFGAYNTTGAPWIFHAQHGFVYHNPGSTNDSIFFYDDVMQAWWWTNETDYPFLYVFDPPADNGGLDIDDAWLWYFEGTMTPRSFGIVTGANAGEFLFFNP